MSEHFEYIDAYFQKQLNDAEREEFEERCISDEAFANDVAFYISSSSALRDILLEEKKKSWAAYNTQEENKPLPAPVKKINFKKWLPYAAAACLALAFLLYPLLSSDSPREISAKYIREELSSISQTMDASRDTLQVAISAFNKKDYNTALVMLEAYYKNHPENSYALRYIGQTNLVKGEYDKAIKTFDELAAKPGYSNPALFLKGVSLLRRDQPGDQEGARKLFQKVVDEQLDGEQQAREWLSNWPR